MTAHDDDPIQRGAAMAADFNAAGHKTPGGVAQTAAAAAPSGKLDPAAQIARAVLEAVRRLANPEISPAAVELVLAEDIRKALESYK